MSSAKRHAAEPPTRRASFTARAPSAPAAWSGVACLLQDQPPLNHGGRYTSQCAPKSDLERVNTSFLIGDKEETCGLRLIRERSEPRSSQHAQPMPHVRVCMFRNIIQPRGWPVLMSVNDQCLPATEDHGQFVEQYLLLGLTVVVRVEACVRIKEQVAVINSCHSSDSIRPRLGVI